MPLGSGESRLRYFIFLCKVVEALPASSASLQNSEIAAVEALLRSHPPHVRHDLAGRRAAGPCPVFAALQRSSLRLVYPKLLFFLKTARGSHFHALRS
jgi:hypothetical protein